MFQIWDKSVSNMLIVGAAGEEVLLGLHFSMGTVWADTALFGQPVLAISARLYTQSMVAQSVPSSSVVSVYGLSLYSDSLQLCNLCLGAK